MDHFNNNSDSYLSASAAENFDDYPVMNLMPLAEVANFQNFSTLANWNITETPDPTVGPPTSVFVPSGYGKHRGHRLPVVWMLTCGLQIWRLRPPRIILKPTATFSRHTRTLASPCRRSNLNPNPPAPQAGTYPTSTQRHPKCPLQPKPPAMVRIFSVSHLEETECSPIMNSPARLLG